MLKRGEEFIIIFIPMMIFFALIISTFHLIKFDHYDYGLKEFTVDFILYVLVYMAGYLLFLKQAHPSYMVPYIFGAVMTPLVLYILLNLPIGIETYTYLSITISAWAVYKIVRKLAFRIFAFSEEEYRRKHNQ